MSDVIDLSAVRAARIPHTSGECACMRCGHRWVGVVPCAVDIFECPSCHLEMGVRAGAVVAPEEDHFTCQCDGQFFHVVRDGAYCPRCGTLHPWEHLTDGWT